MTNTFNKPKKGELLSTMIRMATNAHHGQFDRGGAPYILHCLAVMSMTAQDFPGDEELAVIACGHDIIEDTKTTWGDLREAGMTERVVDGIRALTKMPGETYDEYQERVLANPDARKVKKRDLRHNSDIRRLKGVTDKDIERTAKYHRLYMRIEQRDAQEAKQ